MAERKPIEITKTELLVFLGVVAFAIFILVGGQIKLIDPLAAGIAVIGITAAFMFANYLETKGIFAGHATSVFMVFVVGVLMIVAGLIARGIIPLVITTGDAILDLTTNAILVSLAVVVWVVAFVLLKSRKITASVVDTEDFKFMKKLE
jgi:hypothetical protein